MATQLEQFQKSFSSLNPTERSFYIEKNPTINVGGSDMEYSQQSGQYQAIAPKPTPTIVSSSTVTDRNNTQSGLATAGSAASGTGSGTRNGMTDVMNQFFSNTNNQAKDIKNSLNEQLDLAQIGYDAELAANNATYNSQIRKIQQEATNAKQIATASAVALNPYSQSRGATTSQNFQNAVTSKYAQLETDIRDKHRAADQLARAGYAKEAQQIRQGVQNSINSVLQSTNQALLSFASMSQNQSQFDISQGNLMSRAAQDDFQTYLNTFSGSPQLQSDIDNFNSTGKVSAGLSPIIQKGMQAGYSPDESLSIFQYQTEKVRQQQATEDYRARQLIDASDRQTVAQMRIASMNTIAQTGASLAAQGIQPGTMEYARGIAQATGSSPTTLGATESSTYATIANIGGQLVGLKDTLDGFTKGEDIKNIILSKTGAGIQSLTSPQLAQLTSQINMLAAPIARVMFGERGVLTEPDVARVLSTLPTGASTKDVRDVLYKQILQNAKTGAINKLSVDASSGKNVANMTPYVDKLVKDIDSVLSQLGTTSTTSSKRSYTDPTTGRIYTY